MFAALGGVLGALGNMGGGGGASAPMSSGGINIGSKVVGSGSASTAGDGSSVSASNANWIPALVVGTAVIGVVLILNTRK